MATTTDDPRVKKISTPTTYGLFDEALLIYVGATTQRLGRRLQSHKSDAENGSTSPIYRYIRSEVDDKDDLSIREIDFDSEQEALDALFDSTLNRQSVADESAYDGYEWEPWEVDVLEENSVAEASRRLDASFNACLRAAHKLGLVEEHSHTPVDWDKWDGMLGEVTDHELADRIGCSWQNVIRRRRQLGIDAAGGSGARLDADTVRAVWTQYHLDTSQTYAEVADRVPSSKVNSGRVGKIIREETYTDVDKPSKAAIDCADAYQNGDNT